MNMEYPPWVSQLEQTSMKQTVGEKAGCWRDITLVYLSSAGATQA
jgi:hypothetical protein